MQQQQQQQQQGALTLRAAGPFTQLLLQQQQPLQHFQHQPNPPTLSGGGQHQQGQLVNLVFQVAVPVHHAIHLFAPQFPCPPTAPLHTFNHAGQAPRPPQPPATQEATKPPTAAASPLKPHQPQAHPTPVPSPTPIEKRPATPPPPHRPLPSTSSNPTPANCFELGHGGGSICIHRRRKVGCRLCRVEGRAAQRHDGPKRRIRGPNTYVNPPPPPPPSVALTVEAVGRVPGGRRTGVDETAKDVGRAPVERRVGPSVFSVEALCGATPAVVPRGLESPASTPRLGHAGIGDARG
ncbi:hypothetical protein DFJ73DRAFT_755837 [Zopfochytrium polystomum]|nr:hypothetical protein DFJ73DRAFT_755837 [Zopfochytrium polystomum]